jgi:hypothetical protein
VSLTLGTRLGPYDVIAQIGVGGMRGLHMQQQIGGDP